jgi:hypothetical protein
VDEALMPEAGLDAADMCSLAMISGRARISPIAAMRSSSRPKRRQAFRVDGVRVHARRVVIARLPQIAGRARAFEDAPEDDVVSIADFVRAGVVAPVRGQRVRVDPAPAGEAIEVHAGIGAAIEGGQLHAGWCRGRPRRSGLRRSERDGERRCDE